MPRSILWGFVLRTFLWLAPCFALWYAVARYHAKLAGWLAHLFVDLFKPGIVTAVEQPLLDLMFVTTIKVHPTPAQTALLLPEVNPLLYTYGLAFFLALMLAAHAGGWATWRSTGWKKVLLGAALLLPFQAWGIAFDVLVQVGVKFGPEVSAQAGLYGWRLDAIALGYQIGNLIFPTLIPVVMWALLNRTFIERCRTAPNDTDGR